MPQSVYKDISSVSSNEATELLTNVMEGGFGREKSSSLWNWKHRKNPAGESLGLAAYSPTGKLIALRPFMRWNLKDSYNGVIHAARPVDAVVHPDWQRKGVFTDMTEKILENLKEKGIKLVFNTPNKKSAPGNKKLGWKLLGHPVVWVRPRIINEFVKGKIKHSITSDLIEYNEKLNSLLLEKTSVNSQNESIYVYKDDAYLTWRYGKHPNLNYHIIETSTGYGIVRKDQRAGRSGVVLVDYFMDHQHSSSFDTLLKEVLQKTSGSYVIVGPQTVRKNKMYLFKRGFFPIPWRNVNFAVKAITMNENDVIFQRQKYWEFTMGDFETF